MPSCKEGQCNLKDTRKLKTPDGEEHDCECICKCTSTNNSCENCVCDCKCTPENACKGSDGKYVCECSCTCPGDQPASCCTKKTTRTIVKPCKLVTSEGEEDCDCLCNCESSSECSDCDCNCECTPENAKKGPDGKNFCCCNCNC